MKVVAIIQARMNSSRLPGKILKDLAGKTVLARVVERVGAARLVNEVVIATTISKEDDAVEKFCNTLKIKFFRGSEEDVLDRFYKASKMFQADYVLRITADCPLIDPAVIDKVVAAHFANNVDYTSNTLKETYPDGEDAEIFSFTVLEKVWNEAKLFSEREHVTPYIRKHSEIFTLFNVECDKDLSEKRWTLDTQEDFYFIKKVYDALNKENYFFTMEEILEFLAQYSDFEKINKHIKRNLGYEKSLKNDRLVR